MNDDALRFGIIGAGGIARSYGLAFAECQDARLVAVADVRPEAAHALAEVFACAHFSSCEEMAEQTLLDAVVVCNETRGRHNGGDAGDRSLCCREENLQLHLPGRRLHNHGDCRHRQRLR